MEVTKQTVRVYDNGGKTIDRYSVGIPNGEYWDIYTMGSNPAMFNQYSHTSPVLRRLKGEKRIELSDLPEAVREAIAERQQDE